jgi:hypothetical protein
VNQFDPILSVNTMTNEPSFASLDKLGLDPVHDITPRHSGHSNGLFVIHGGESQGGRDLESPFVIHNWPQKHKCPLHYADTLVYRTL